MFARTARLLLRPAWPEDHPKVETALAHPDLAARIVPAGRQAGDPRLPDLLAFTRTRGTPRLVGGAGIIAADDGAMELRYWIDRAHWGLGFATEAAGAVLGMARANGLHGLRALHAIDRPAAGRVLRKLGFRATGRVSLRFVPALGYSLPHALFEEGAADEPPADLAHMELYKDAALAAA